MLTDFINFSGKRTGLRTVIGANKIVCTYRFTSKCSMLTLRIILREETAMNLKILFIFLWRKFNRVVHVHFKKTIHLETLFHPLNSLLSIPT